MDRKRSSREGTSSDKHDELFKIIMMSDIQLKEFLEDMTRLKSCDSLFRINDLLCLYPGIYLKRTLVVQALSGKTCTVEASWPETVGDVKAKACEKLRLSDKKYTLVHNGKELDDMSLVCDVFIISGSKLQLLPRTGSGLVDPVKRMFVYYGDRAQRLGTLKVQTLSGETCTVEASWPETVRNVKAEACEKLRLSDKKYTLVQNGIELDDMSLVGDLYIISGSKLQLLPRTGSGLGDSVKRLFAYYQDRAQRLVKCFPEFLMDMSRALTEKDLSRISQAIGSGWQHLGAELGISQAEIEQICEDNRKTSMKIFNMLRQWSIQASVNATVNTLHNAMKNCRKVTFDMKAIERVFAGI